MEDPSLQQSLALAKRLQALQDTLARNGYLSSGADQLSSYSSGTRNWMKSLNAQLFGNGVVKEDAFSDYMLRALKELTDQLEEIKDKTLARPERLVCCILNGLYEVASRHEGDDDVDEIRRKVELGEFIHWVQFFRSSLIVIRRLSQRGPVQTVFASLAFDVSSTIKKALESALVGPISAAIVMFEWAIQQVGQRITIALGKTRCVPLMDLWGVIITWMYNHQGGFMRRARGFVLSVLVRLRRDFIKNFSSIGAGVDAKINYDWRVIDTLIKIMDILLSSLTILTTCRVPIGAEPEDSTDTGDDGSGGNGGDGSGGNGDDNEGGGDDDSSGDDNQDDGRIGDPLPIGDVSSGEEDSSTIPDPPGFINPGSVPTGDYVYLTTPNVALILTQGFNVDPREAQDIAISGNCREELSDDTIRILEAIGL